MDKKIAIFKRQHIYHDDLDAIQDVMDSGARSRHGVEVGHNGVIDARRAGFLQKKGLVDVASANGKPYVTLTSKGHRYLDMSREMFDKI